MEWLRRMFGGCLGQKQKKASKKTKRAVAKTDKQQDENVMAILDKMPEQEVKVVLDCLSTAGTSGVQQSQFQEELLKVLQKTFASQIMMNKSDNLWAEIKDNMRSIDEKLSVNIQELKALKDQVDTPADQMKIVNERQQRMQKSLSIQETQCLPVPPDPGFNLGISANPHCSSGNVVSETCDSVTNEAVLGTSEPRTREEFLQYSRFLTLNPNTAHKNLHLSQWNTVVINKREHNGYPDHEERFEKVPQVLGAETLTGRCYWEVEWRGNSPNFSIGIAYGGIARKGHTYDCCLGRDSPSWCFCYDYTGCSFMHNNKLTPAFGTSSSRIGVLLDHGAGTLSFYSVTDIMFLLHRAHATFSEPVYLAFKIRGRNNMLRLC